ncbi:UNVERIFIED_CONTAM: putative mitochondrial protein [Sesamum latifolium]|uniref:Mitochondrial protein n=1 Tax=Sesamum latifolium TaxID=2727402 RepID=A0AAW2Y8Q2_9LAMI
MDKSSMVLSKNVEPTLQLSLPNILGIRKEEQLERYLGLPSIVGRSRRGVFAYIRDRIWKKLQGWSGRNLSQAGKAIMIKSVVQAIPTYAMSVFRLPNSLLGEVQSMASNFFWHNKDQRKIHWISWERLCKKKEEGGIGFRSLKAFNTALPAKQLWRLITKPQSLIA